MRKKKPILFIMLLIFSCIVFWCWFWYFSIPVGNRNVKGIYIDETLRLSSYYNYNIDYCKLLKKATSGDAESIRKLVSLDFGQHPGCNHGAVIVELIALIGEKKFINSLGIMNDEQKSRLESKIKHNTHHVGKKSELRDKTIEELFPNLYMFLMLGEEDMMSKKNDEERNF